MSVLQLTEALLRYNGAPGSVGICHVVVDYAGKRALAGELDDNPGTSVTNALETITSDIAKLYFDGKFDFRMYEYIPLDIVSRGPAIYRIDWRSPPLSMPVWEPTEPDDAFVVAAAPRTKARAEYSRKALGELPLVEA